MMSNDEKLELLHRIVHLPLIQREAVSSLLRDGLEDLAPAFVTFLEQVNAGIPIEEASAQISAAAEIVVLHRFPTETAARN